jgi:hypothetical protein
VYIPVVWVVVARNSEEKRAAPTPCWRKEKKKFFFFSPFFYFFVFFSPPDGRYTQTGRSIGEYPPSHFLDGAPPAQPLSRHQELRHRKPRRHSRSDFTLSTDVRLFACAPSCTHTHTQHAHKVLSVRRARQHGFSSRLASPVVRHSDSCVFYQVTFNFTFDTFLFVWLEKEHLETYFVSTVNRPRKIVQILNRRFYFCCC